MPFIYVYELSDFTTTIPDEQFADAVGSPPFTVTTASTLTRIQIEVTDGDANFDEIDASQTLTNDITLNGVNYFAGDRIFGNYTLSGAGIPDLFSVTVGGTNNGMNTTTVVATLVPLQPNTTYTYTSEANFRFAPEPYDDFLKCFAAGTLIHVPSGQAAVEDLRVGDLVTTRDNGDQPIRWIGRSTVAGRGKFAPIHIAANAFGLGVPQRDLRVSRQHRMMVQSKIAERMFGTAEVLVPAIKLTELPGCDLVETDEMVTYFHLLLDRHEILIAEGAFTESLYIGETSARLMAEEEQAEIQALFPDLLVREVAPAGMIQDGRRAKSLVERHRKNAKDLAPPASHSGPAAPRHLH